MKKYIKPAIVEVKVESESLMNVGSLNDQVGNRQVLANDFDDLDWDEE